MLTRITSVLVLSTVIAMPFFITGCETSHSETTHENLLGGTTHQETTTTQNPITGATSTETSKQVVH